MNVNGKRDSETAKEDMDRSYKEGIRNNVMPHQMWYRKEGMRKKVCHLVKFYYERNVHCISSKRFAYFLWSFKLLVLWWLVSLCCNSGSKQHQQSTNPYYRPLLGHYMNSRKEIVPNWLMNLIVKLHATTIFSLTKVLLLSTNMQKVLHRWEFALFIYKCFTVLWFILVIMDSVNQLPCSKKVHQKLNQGSIRQRVRWDGTRVRIN